MPSRPKPSRRAFLSGAAAAGALAWVPAFRVTPASAQATSAAPPGFPSSISLYQQAYSNWAGMISIDNVWTAAPASPADVVTLANWAQASGYRLRAKGMSHGWSPILLPAGNTGAGHVLVDTTQHLTSIATAAGSPATVTVQAGATMDNLTTALAAGGTASAPSRLPVTSRSAECWRSARTAAPSREPARPGCPGRPTGRCPT